jgi:hypothetical protein
VPQLLHLLHLDLGLQMFVNVIFLYICHIWPFFYCLSLYLAIFRNAAYFKLILIVVCCFSFCAALVSLPTVPLNLIVCIFPSLHTFLSPVRLEKWVSWHKGLNQLSKTTFVKTPVPALPPFPFPLQGALGGRGMKELRGRPFGGEDASYFLHILYKPIQ